MGSINFLMRSPTTALLWEIRREKGWLLWVVVALISFGWLFNAVWGGTFRATEDGRQQLMSLDCWLACCSIFLVFGTFHYTEFNPQKQWTGFPYHLFTLPVRTWRLVALPMIAGVGVAELTYLAWVKLIFVHDMVVRPAWFAALIGAYLVFFQTVLWALAAFRILRIIVLSLVGTSLVGVAFMPFFSQLTPKWWLSENVLIAELAALALLAYLIAWNVVALQRTGGGVRENWLKKRADQILDLLPRRRSPFGSAAAAQFWLEWRRSGLLLPGVVAAVLLLVVGPLSWHLRDETAIVLWILPQTLAMPVVLAAAMSKGFSKPDFWSTDLAVPSFVATRPMATGGLVVAKLKAAALSAALTWTLVFVFLWLWLNLWAKVDQLSMIRIGFWMVYGHSVYPQYAIAALILATCILLTWKFLVNGFCVGLSGNRTLFIGSPVAYCVAAIIGITAFAWLLNHDQQFKAWVRHDPNELLFVFERMIAAAIVAKFWLAAFSWRRISWRRTWQYLLLWAGATLLLITLAKLLWANGCLTLSLMSVLDFLPLDPYRLECFLILAGLLTVPFARLGFAPSSLAANRHGKFIGKDVP
jgi:hypothetical protein